MKSIVTLLAAIVLMTACQNQAQEKTATNATTVAADPKDNTTVQWLDSAKDMGQITEGQKLEVAFRFRNSGNKPLIIKSVQPSCGCTVADYPKEPIAAGQEGVIKGVFDSNGKSGKNNKTLTVYANTGGEGSHTLSFTVDVQKKN